MSSRIWVFMLCSRTLHSSVYAVTIPSSTPTTPHPPPFHIQYEFYSEPFVHTLLSSKDILDYDKFVLSRKINELFIANMRDILRSCLNCMHNSMIDLFNIISCMRLFCFWLEPTGNSIAVYFVVLFLSQYWIILLKIGCVYRKVKKKEASRSG